MKGTPAIYLGRIIDKTKFRTFVYGVDGKKKLVESWDAYEAHMATGIWFATLKETNPIKEVEEKPKTKAKVRHSKIKEPPQKAARIVEDDTVFEVTDENK